MSPRDALPALPPDAARRIADNLARLRTEVARAAARAGRDAGSVQLVAVTKYAPAAATRILHELGVRDFGESTVQGLARKREELGPLPGARWHLIGHLQRNKVARTLELAAAIHSIDSTRLAAEVALQSRRRGLPVPELYVEVNWSGDPGKTGLLPAAVRSVLAALAAEGLAARGLMGMAPHSDDPEAARPTFRGLRQLRDALVEGGALASGAGLSMGMSGDYRVAVEEGATVIRVGSLLLAGLEGGGPASGA